MAGNSSRTLDSYELSQIQISEQHNHDDHNIVVTSQSNNTEHSEGWWDWVKGSTPESHLYLGMWTWHFKNKSRREDRWQNELVAVNYKSFFVGTLLNSFSKRMYVAGVQRELFSRSKDNWGYNIGYRAGGVYGYGKEFGSIAKKLPILPVIQPYIAIHYKRVGVEASYVGAVLTAEFFIRF